MAEDPFQKDGVTDSFGNAIIPQIGQFVNRNGKIRRWKSLEPWIPSKRQVFVSQRFTLAVVEDHAATALLEYEGRTQETALSGEGTAHHGTGLPC